MRIKIFTTGGTIDKNYAEAKGTLNFSFSGKQAITEIDDKIKLNFSYDIKQLLAKDSLEITSTDRKNIKKACENAKESKILLTHGTDTMVETARILSEIKNKVIILTGATRPYKFKDSDAEFNVGVAIGALNVLKEGVYIAMNGRIYDWDKVEKSPDGRFIDK